MPSIVHKAGAAGAVLACLTFLTGAGRWGRPAQAPAGPRPPNVVLMMADDLGYAELGSYGQGRIKTPNLDRLAAEGLRFRQFYSGSPVCAPSRAALLTGLHTGHTPVRGNHELGGFLDSEERGQWPLPAGTATLATMLKARGYATAIVGKWGLGGPGSEGVPTRHGFDVFYGYLDQKQAHNHYPSHLWRNEMSEPLGNGYFSPHQRLAGDPGDAASYKAFTGTAYAPDLIAAEALRFIRANRDRPFFLYLAFTLPHLALQVPDEEAAPYAFDETPYSGDRGYLPHPRPRAAYAGMITRMDAHAGQVLRLIAELGLERDTLVVFTSDNGTTYTGGVDSAFFRSVGPLRGFKDSVYEGGIRVPMIARWPGRIGAGRTTDAVAALWDLLPTIAEIAGATVPARVDGISLVATLTARGRQREHDYLYWEHFGVCGGQQAVRMGQWKVVRLGIRTRAPSAIQLYDLLADPGEAHDVAPQHPEIAAQGAATMARAHSPAALPQWNLDPDPASRPIDYRTCIPAPR